MGLSFFIYGVFPIICVKLGLVKDSTSVKVETVSSYKAIDKDQTKSKKLIEDEEEEEVEEEIEDKKA